DDDLGAPHERGHGRQRHADGAQRLPALQEQARDAEEKRREEAELDDGADERHVVDVAELGRGERRGIPETEDGADPHGAECGGGDPRGPAERAAASRRAAATKRAAAGSAQLLSLRRRKPSSPWGTKITISVKIRPTGIR